jgi:hypothetical protein
MSCRSNLVPWYFSDTVLPCANPIVCSHPWLGSPSDLDMIVLRYGEGSNAELDSEGRVGVCESERGRMRSGQS